MTETPEGRLKADIRAYLRSKGAFWSMVTGGPYSKVGDPDMVVCFAGRYVAIEAKTYSGRMSEMQKLRKKQIEEAGGVHICARSVDDVRAVLDAIKQEWEDVHEKKE